jgi:hypothetical protein
MMRLAAGRAGVRPCLCLAVRLATGQAGERAASGPAPVNPHASPEARALLRYLDSISGKYTITVSIIFRTQVHAGRIGPTT